MEVRMLGPLQVRRSDGTAVADNEWKTTRTLDLLRLLALHNGEPVPVPFILEAVWPNADENRGRASLRTAASQLRKVLGPNTVERRLSGLLLHGAWVDTQAYETLLTEAAASRRAGDLARTVAAVQESEALYVGDVDLPDRPGDWLYAAHDHLRRERCRGLLTGAEAAAELFWMRDSLRLAERAAAIEQCEEVTRVLMRGYAGLGEMEKALAVFERARRDLVTRCGIDPSPQTRALHLQLLADTAVSRKSAALVGLEDTVDELAGLLARSVRTASGGGVVWLEGPEGSGRETITRAACRTAGLALHDTGRDAWLAASAQPDLGSVEIPTSDVVLMPHAETVAPHAVKLMLTLARRHGGVLVVPVTTAPDGGPPADVAQHVVRVRSLSNDELYELAALVLQGDPSERLVRRLRIESGQLGGAAARIAREWLARGSVVWSVDGLEHTRDAEPHGFDVVHALHRRLRMMSPFAEDVAAVLAAADGAVPDEEVVTVVMALYAGATAAEVRIAINQLLEAELVGRGPAGLRPVERSFDRLLEWMRPSARARLREVVTDGVGRPEDPDLLDGADARSPFDLDAGLFPAQGTITSRTGRLYAIAAAAAVWATHGEHAALLPLGA